MRNRPNSSSALESLAESAYADVFELLHTGIAVMSATGAFLYCNQAFLSMFNLPSDIRGKHVTDFFLTAEQGVMTTIRTRKPTFCSSLTTTDAQGISFRYPLLDDKGKLYGVIIESISPSIGPERMQKFLDTIHDLEEKSNYFEQKVRKKPGSLYTFESIIGNSNAIMALKKKGKIFARGNEPILVLGESGTGKELVAQALHSASSRADKPFVTVNCAALPHDLMEAELFGYEAGAFTGAKSSGKKGQFELAEGGTIFLDEIGELPLTLQAKLLRVLENHEIQKLGNTSPRYVDFRLLSATNRNLEQMVVQGLFREDLYYRLNLFDLVVPPLRERLADIPLLAYSIIVGLLGPERGRNIRIEKGVLSLCSAHPWRGNVRELRNVLTYALYSMQESESVLRIRHLPERFFHKTENDFLHSILMAGEKAGQQSEAAGTSSERLSNSRIETERKAILSALEKAGGNKVKAARILGIARSNLYKKIAALGMESS